MREYACLTKNKATQVNIVKRGIASYHSIRHSDQSSETHKKDVEQAKQNRDKRRAIKVEIADDKVPFASDVSLLGGGRRFAMRERDGRRCVMTINSHDWDRELDERKSDLSWYHQPRNKSKSGYVVRKIKDRTKLSEKDKQSRDDTDLLRETIDLRPDHSRALQYFLQAGHKEAVDQMINQIMKKKMVLFEKIYTGRKVLYVSRHDDSGQFHHDLWHSGISENPRKLHRGAAVRQREPFRSYGVGTGVSSWFRHYCALTQGETHKGNSGVVMGAAFDVLKRNIQSAKRQNGEEPRDIRLISNLDGFVSKELDKLSAGLKGEDAEIPRRAHDEYKAWLLEGYEAGELGVRQSPESELVQVRETMKIQQAKMQALQKENESFVAANAKLATIAQLARQLIIAIAQSSLWLGLEKPNVQAAATARALSSALGMTPGAGRKIAKKQEPRKNEHDIH